MEVTITPEFSDSTPLIEFGPGHFVQTDMFWFAYHRGDFDMRHPRNGETVFSRPDLSPEIASGVHAVTVTRLGDIYGRLFNTALQDFRYSSAAGVRDATSAVAFEPIPEPASSILLATVATALSAVRRRR